MDGLPDRLSSACVVLALLVSLAACGERQKGASETPDIPRGFFSTLTVEVDDRVFQFGPFVGYHFRPETPQDLRRLKFVCFNEGGFYSTDAPPGSLLFEGDARLMRLPVETIPDIAPGRRMKPVFAEQIPQAWLETRPDPKDEFVHFHSCYDATGPVAYGYWLRHAARRNFTYDMGGRVGTESPLYHRAVAGVDKRFAKIVEFDKGPVQ